MPRSRVIRRGLLALASMAVAAMLLADAAVAGFDLAAGGERTSPPVAEVARAAEPGAGASQSSTQKQSGAERRQGGPSGSAKGPCEQSLAIAASKGLRVPDGWELKCPGPGLDWEGGTHWGVTCPYASCPEGAGPYISISNPTYYVVAHELCHANFGNDELMADSCAAKHGASLESSPYS